ncbi:MAG TPA: Asp-tRNA(Asn)/Glu-tRNA(Gln) amidotransferase subunit GatA [Planctomycetaceae bacterium]|jgi:aspartyl-tRNA(Asn)/glutamyl-tRNA(Gln) amidotransferase subunit A|nr:Asp-tRNA(Asn)/Glu-tRNA(Gln) amidotransferase subunit GatA [Planctomycetaceae bacterium]
MSISGDSTSQLLAAMASGELSAVDVASACLDQIAAHDPQVQAFLHVDRDGALQQAALVDEKRRAGKPLGQLAGLPVAVKDVVSTRGLPTTCGSRILQRYVPPYDAEIIRRLRAADAVILGKTNMDEFAMGSSTENSAFQITRNPWDAARTPGGSSGGSAAAVAAGMSSVAIGSDTGGSIRQPAGFCGIVGMKPTYGRVSRYGLLAYASSLDQLGPLATDVAGTATLLEVIAGHDSQDSTSVDRPVPEYGLTLEQPLSGLRIGLAREHFAAGLDAEVAAVTRAAADVYRSLGAKVVDVTLPHSKYAVAAYYLIAPSEAASNLARYDGVHYGHRAEKFDGLIDMYATSRGEGFGAEVKRRIMLGNYALSAGYYDAYYLKALKVRRLIRGDFDRAFESCDVLLSPVAPTPAFKVGELVDDPLAMYLSDIYTLSANLAGLPGISLPGGFSLGGLPIGIQLQGPPFAEETLLRAARMFERETPWHTKRPTLAVRR